MFIFRVIFLLLLVTDCILQQCSRTEKTKTTYQRKHDYYRGWYNDPKMEVESETYTCVNVSLPLSDDFRGHCENCKSILVISSLSDDTLPPLSFNNYSFLSDIYMDNVGITEILPAAFNSLNRLRKLVMTRNEIHQIPDGSLSSLSQLEILDISSNNLENLSQHSLIGLNNLQLLNISRNLFITFDSKLLPATKQIQIDLSFNKLTNVQLDKFSGLVQMINFSHNFIREASGCFAAIEIVKLDNNNLRRIQNFCANNESSNILELNLGFNVLEVLTSGVFDNIQTVEKLHLENNNISFLQADILAKLPYLKTLNLSGNHFREFEYGLFQHVQNLECLDLSRNNFTAMKRYFHSLSKLEELDISNNNLNILDSSQLIQDLPALKKISFDTNRLSCEDLIDIIQIFKQRNITVTHGSTQSAANIHGMACNESKKDADVLSYKKHTSEEKESDLLTIKHLLETQEKDGKSIYNFFNTGFKDSNFYKYLEALRQERMLRFNETEIVNYFNRDFRQSSFVKYFDNVRYPSKLNNSIDDYFNNYFKNSSFVKYIETLQRTQQFLCESFDNSVFYNFFNRDFEKTNFFQNLQNIRKSRNTLNYNEREIPNVEKFVNVPNIDKKNEGILLIVVILLTVILFVVSILAVISVKFYFVFVNKKERSREHVELMEQ